MKMHLDTDELRKKLDFGRITNPVFLPLAVVMLTVGCLITDGIYGFGSALGISGAVIGVAHLLARAVQYMEDHG
jgi:hypothetical protein